MKIQCGNPDCKSEITVPDNAVMRDFLLSLNGWVKTENNWYCSGKCDSVNAGNEVRSK